MSDIESRLFNAVIDTLRLNRALAIANRQMKGVVELLDGLLSGEVTAMPMTAVRHLVLEHDIGLTNLVSGIKKTIHSPHGILARAAMHVSNKDELMLPETIRKQGPPTIRL